MLLILLAFLMKFVDLTKLQPPRGVADALNNNNNINNNNNNNNNNVTPSLGGWRHRAARHKTQPHSNSSSTSSGCDSNSTSTSASSSSSSSLKENRATAPQQHHAITPQQLEQIRHYQRLQQQQLQLLQQQLLQRRRLQQQLRAEGLTGTGGGAATTRKAPSVARAATTNSNVLTCNQQYLLQQRQQHQQLLHNDNNNFMQLHHHNINNNNSNRFNNNNNNNNNNIKNNNNNVDNLFLRAGLAKGQKSRRGMTEFSTNNDFSNNSHHSQPLQNSPHHQRHQQKHHNSTQFHPHQPLLQHHHQNHQNHHNNHLTFKQNHNYNHKINQQSLPLNSSANINHCASAITTTTPSPTSAKHSPLHYKKPLNSPNNSPFAYAYYGANHQQQQQQQYPGLATSPSGGIATAATAQQQQQLRLLHSKLSQTNYQQHLNDLLLQHQHLQQQQQQLLTAAGNVNQDENGTSGGGGGGNGEDLSDECLKKNVAIVLNNLDRYNNALRSIILNEQVSNSLFHDSLLDFSSISSSNSNNNFLLNSNTNSKMATPESDYNSNATTPGSRVGSNFLPMQQHQQQQQQQPHHDNVVGFAACGGGVGGGVSGGGFFPNVAGGVSNNLNCSLASSHDFTHDNSDYQWFLDYGYRDGCGMQRSVLSSLSASYNGIGELLYYEDLAKNIDANLAEVDMESFRAEDIHSLLSQLPSYCKGLGGGANGRLQQSLMQQHMMPAHNMSQTSTSSTNELIDNSICKSELLFSPVKESHISVDSLDLDAYPDDGDIILTCKANKDNYTIAFEGSVLYSDESFYEPNEISLKNKQNFINLHSNLDDIVKRKSLEVSMSRSEHQLTTWSKLRKSNAAQLQRYPSGNNNTSDTLPQLLHAAHCTVRKSSSLPNLRTKKDPTCSRQKLNVSHVSTSTTDSSRSRNLLPMCQMPISCSSTTVSTSERLTPNSQQQPQQSQRQSQHNHPQLQQRHHHHHHHHDQQQQKQAGHGSCCSVASASSATLQKQPGSGGNISSGSSGTSSNQPAFNLVKLFIKQKSSTCSSEDHPSAHTCMDVSSGCWPSSDAAGSSSSSSLEQRLRKKSMNDSGKGSALSRHDEEELMMRRVEAEDSFQMDSLEVCEQEQKVLASNSTPKKHSQRNNDVFFDEESTVTGSPAHRRRSLPMRHPQVCQLALQHQHNNNNGSSSGSLHSSDGTSRSNSEQLTQVYLSGGNSSDGTVERRKTRRREVNIRTSSTSEMITRSMQTSCGSISTRSSLSDRFRFVPPSFLAKLNNLGEEKQAPIYVIYPNYALPDLGFVKTNTTDVIFSPFNYTATVGGVSSANLKNRYGGVSEDEILKNIDYKHVVDWKSLATLLPAEYRKRLQHIPEVGSLNLDGEMSQKPLFCMTPPIRHANRAHICDCAQFFQQTAHQTHQQQEGSSSSGSSQQPSSGYRGSSTLLTDSELDTAVAAPDPLKQMYVYQYEQQGRMDSGVDMMGSPANKVPPTPQPRGILRKAASQGARNKRNSMIEEQNSKMTKQEKRRSLQEPPYNHNQHLGCGSSEELYGALAEEEGFEEQIEAYYAGLQTNQRLSRKDMDARTRAENFLSSLPRSELKYYAEIASILESSEDQKNAADVQYDAAALKKEVSRALSQQKKVSFNEEDHHHQQLQQQQQQQQLQQQQQQQQQQFLHPETRQKRFSTPPNSPNMSIAGGLRMPPSSHTAPRRCSQQDSLAGKKAALLETKEQLKISNNRFKRLQIQWELLSKDSSMMLKDLASEKETKSGGSTPTAAQAAAAAAAAQRSRIPRPVSYPAGKITSHDTTKATTRSPSRIVPPKRYSMVSPSTATAPSSGGAATTPTAGATRARTPTSRAAATAPNTPKRRVQSPRTTPRVR